MKMNVEFDPNSTMAKVKNNVSLCQKVLDVQVMKDSNYYCPMDTSMLQKSAIAHTVIGSGMVQWVTPYAREQYYGHPNKSHQKNPNAAMKWFEVAKAKCLKNWEKLVNDEYRKNDK